MQQQRGFTLIELIIVIVILGILAVTAAPRFIDIQSDARAETINGVKGALQGASQLVFAKAAIAGVQKLESSDSGSQVSIAGQIVETHLGYPDANAYSQISSTLTGSSPVRGIDLYVDIDGNQLELTNVSTNNEYRITFAGESSVTAGSDTSNECYVSYKNATTTQQVPIITAVTTEC